VTAVLRKALAALAATPVLAGLFLLGVVAAFSVPNEDIVRHIADRPEVVQARRADNGRVIDADTECIGLSIGLYESAAAPDGLLEKAVTAESLYGCQPFFHWIATGEAETHRDYFRYWHGATLLFRPALAVMPYNDLRGLLFTVSAALLVLLAWRIGGDFGPAAALAVAAPFVVINALGLWVVATKAVTWFLAMGGALYMSRRRSAEAPFFAFFLIGALTAYFDFFTAPAFVFSMAALVWAIYDRRNTGAFPSWKTFVGAGLFWSAGWAGFILIKIAIAASLSGAGAWNDFTAAAAFRLRGESEYVDSFIPGAAIFENLKALKSVWAPVAVIAYLILPFATAARRARWRELAMSRSVIFAIIGAPLAWLEVMSNHSQIHAAFTQINFAPAFILAGLVIEGSPALGAKDSRSAAGA
jgi:hypothetical protein